MNEDFLLELFCLAGRVAVVTGGGGAICGAISRAIANAGGQVIVLDLSETSASNVAREINQAGGTAVPFRADVLNKKSLEDVCREVVNRFSRIDFLINGAGGNKQEATTAPDLSFFDIPEDGFRWVFDLNFISAVLACQVFGKVIAQQEEGAILNISSINSIRPLTRIPAYSSAKAALSNFTQWLAVHVSHHYSSKIRVNAVAPGFVITEQNRFLLTQRDSGRLTPRGESVIEHTPLKRFGTPEEIASAALWLLSPAATFVHGAVIAVDGGFTAFSGV